MSKLKIIDKKSIKSIKSELELLSKMNSPYIVNMHFAFQDKENLYLVMDFLSGGDLRFHISRHKKFSEEQTRFFICILILALEYIHSNNIIHRDIKPENLVLEKNGYLRVTDFGIAMINTFNSHVETSGTPGYMAPEVLKSLNHSFCADFFAIGVMGYEFMKGERPYNGKNRKEIKEKILKYQVIIKFEEEKENWTKESVDFINKLLIREPEKRLGYRNIKELKEHPWIKYYPWNLIKDKKLPAPFIPENKDNFDKRYCENSEKRGEETDIRYMEIIEKNNMDNLFINYYYDENEDKKRIIKRNIEKKIKINKRKIKNISKNNNNHNYMLNISQLLRKKMDIPKKSFQTLERDKENINFNQQFNDINKINDKKKITNKTKHFKSGSISEINRGNMLYINFNINNNTINNNNVVIEDYNLNNKIISNKNKNMHNNLNNKNALTERINFILQNKLFNNYQTHNENVHLNNKIKNKSLYLGLNDNNSSFNTLRRKNNLKNKSIDNSKCNNKNKFLLNKNLSKKYKFQLNSYKNINNNFDFYRKNIKNISLNKIRYTFSHSYGKIELEKIIPKTKKEEISNTLSLSNEMSYRINLKKINKIPSGRISHRGQKSEFNLSITNNKETLTINSKRKNFNKRIKSLDKSNNNNSKSKNIEIKYSIQELLNNSKNNIKIKKLNYIYSKKSMLERKLNQFNFPLSNSKSYQTIIPKNKKDNFSKSKEKLNQPNIFPQVNKITKTIKLNEEWENIKEKNSINSIRNSLNEFNNKKVIEKIKVNKNININ